MSVQNQWTLINSIASSPVGSKGSKACFEGRFTTRLPVGPDKQDTRFFINAMQISGNTCFLIKCVKILYAKLFGFVPLSSDGKVVTFVKVNSLAKRLLLDKKDIYAAARAQMLPTLINSYFSSESLKQFVAGLTIEAEQEKKEYEKAAKEADGKFDAARDINAFEAMAEPNDKEAASSAKEKAAVEKKQAWQSTLNTVDWTQAAIKAIQAAVRNFDLNSKMRVSGEVIKVKHNNMDFEFLAKYENNTLQLIQSYKFANQFDPEKPVYQVMDFFALKRRVVKLDKPKANAEVGIDNEIAILKKIHRVAHREHLQHAPAAVFDIPEYGRGYIGEFYPGGDLLDFYNSNEATMKNRYSFFMPIMEAMKEMHQDCGIFHGDMKPEQIILTDGVEKIRVIDWEGAFDSRAGVDSCSALHTPDFTSYKDRNNLNAKETVFKRKPRLRTFKRQLSKYKTLREQNARKASLNKKIFEPLTVATTARADFAKATEMQDVMSFGAILFELLTNELPYEQDAQNYYKENVPFRQELLKGHPQKVIDLIRDMTVQNPEKRITSAQAYARAKALNWDFLQDKQYLT